MPDCVERCSEPQRCLTRELSDRELRDRVSYPRTSAMMDYLEDQAAWRKLRDCGCGPECLSSGELR